MRIHKRIHIGILLCVGVAIACTAQAQSEKNKDQQREQVLRELLDRAYKGETAVSPDSSATNIMTKEEYLRALKQKEASAANADIKQTAAATNQLPAQPIESDTANSGGQAQSAFPTFPMPQNADQQNTTPPSELQQDQATSAQSPTQTADQPSTTNALPVPQVQQSPQQPRTPTKSEETRTINFPDMPLEQFLDFYAELTGKTILRPMNLPNVTITLKSQTPLTTKESIQACDSVLALNNITMIPTGEKFITAVPSAQALKEAAAFSEIDPEELPETDQFVTKIVQLKHTEPSEIMSSLQPFANMPNGLVPIESSQVIVLRDYAPNIKRMMEVINKVDVPSADEFKLEVIPIRYGKIEDIYGVMQGLISGGTSMPSSSSSRSSRPSFASNFGNQNSGQRGQQPFAQQQQQGSSAQSDFRQRLSSIVSRAMGEEQQILESAQIIPDMRSNSLVVYANQNDMEMITNIVSKLDVALAQVLIEAVIIDVSLQDSLNYGISVLQNPRTSGNATGAGGINTGPGFLSGVTNLSSSLPDGFSYFGEWSGDLEMAVQALATSGNATVLQRPRILTTHAVPAEFFNGKTVPYITSSYYGYSSAGPSVQYQQLRVGIGLAVTPFITPDGLVVMEIYQTIEDIAGSTKIGNDQVPNTTSRYATSTVSVNDGDTIVLGGFIKTSEQKNRSGVPVLKDIPLLGALFRSSNNSNDRSELIVMLRPTVLETPEDAAMITEDEKKRLPGISHAEKKLKEEEQALRKKFERMD